MTTQAEPVRRSDIAQRHRGGIIKHHPTLVSVAMASNLLAVDASATCEDREIVLTEDPQSLSCEAMTCAEKNSYDPGPNGCVMAFGTPVSTPGRDLLFTVVRPPGVSVDVTVSPSTFWDVALYATSSSDPDVVASSPDACIAGVDEGFDGEDEFLSDLRNTGSLTDTIYVIVDSATTSPTSGCGPFQIDFTWHPIEPVGVADPAGGWVPGIATFRRAAPNPLRSQVWVTFHIPSEGTHTRLGVFDVAGTSIRWLVDDLRAAGEHRVRWDGLDRSARPAPAGVYFLRLETGGHRATRRVVALR